MFVIQSHQHPTNRRNGKSVSWLNNIVTPSITQQYETKTLVLHQNISLLFQFLIDKIFKYNKYSLVFVLNHGFL